MLRLPSVHLFSSSYNTVRFIMIHTKVSSGQNWLRPGRPEEPDSVLPVSSLNCMTTSKYTLFHCGYPILIKIILISDRKWILSYERHYKSLFYTLFIHLFVNLVIGIPFSWRFLEKFISRAPSSDCCCVIVNTVGKFEIMTRIMHADFDLLTPKGLSTKVFSLMNFMG